MERNHLQIQAIFVVFRVLLIIYFKCRRLALRRLARQKADFVRYDEQESGFSKINAFISKASVLPTFHPTYETKIVSDTSKQGLGAILL